MKITAVVITAANLRMIWQSDVTPYIYSPQGHTQCLGGPAWTHTLALTRSEGELSAARDNTLGVEYGEV